MVYDMKTFKTTEFASKLFRFCHRFDAPLLEKIINARVEGQPYEKIKELVESFKGPKNKSVIMYTYPDMFTPPTLIYFEDVLRFMLKDMYVLKIDAAIKNRDFTNALISDLISKHSDESIVLDKYFVIFDSIKPKFCSKNILKFCKGIGSTTLDKIPSNIIKTKLGVTKVLTSNYNFVDIENSNEDDITKLIIDNKIDFMRICGNKFKYQLSEKNLKDVISSKNFFTTNVNGMSGEAIGLVNARAVIRYQNYLDLEIFLKILEGVEAFPNGKDEIKKYALRYKDIISKKIEHLDETDKATVLLMLELNN